jgi:hypothetical protein
LKEKEKKIKKKIGERKDKERNQFKKGKFPKKGNSKKK